MILFAIDPGEKHCGWAEFRDNKLWSSGECTPDEMYAWLEESTRFDQVVMEEYRVYPWLLQQHGYSTVPTIEVIGVIKYICRCRGLSLETQPATIKKVVAARFGKRLSSRNRHARDAEMHGLYYLGTRGEIG